MLRKIAKLRQLIKESGDNFTAEMKARNDWSSTHSRDNSSNEFFKMLEPFRKKKKEITESFADLKITFDCGDYGGSYCLCEAGLKTVLDALESNEWDK